MTRYWMKSIGCAAALLLAGQAALASDTLKIGSFVSVTGGASFLGDPELKTIQLYVDQLNAQGGVLGKPITFIHYDVSGDAKKARTAVKRLINNDKVDIIIGGSTTGTTMAVVPLAEKAKVPFISMAAAVVITEPVKKWVFKVAHSDKMACLKIFEDMTKRGIKKIGMLSGTGGFGKSMRKQCQGVSGDAGITIAADETYGPKDTDMTPQLTKLKNAEGLDAILIAGFGQGPAIATKNYRQVGITLPLYHSHGVASKKFIELAGSSAEGARFPASALLVADKLPDGDPQKPIVAGYKNAYEARYGTVSTFGGHGYDSLHMAIEAIKRAGSFDKAKVRDALEQTSGFMGTAGLVNMSADDHLGLDLSAFRMLEIKNEDWVLIQ